MIDSDVFRRVLETVTKAVEKKQTGNENVPNKPKSSASKTLIWIL